MSGSKVLLVDDEVEFVETLAMRLETRGLKVAIAENGMTAIEKVKEETFDAILLDVPCSNTGVLRRRVDARWRLTPGLLQSLLATQRQILRNALPCLKPGGRLVYSTCSLEPEENQQQIHLLLESHPQLSLRRSTLVTPFRHQTDGAFAALLA